jgi:GNAT superfamily N-acetyltransferase
MRAETPSPELNRFLYTAVGGDLWWTERLDWRYDRWLAYLDRPEHETWVGYDAGTPAGYFELERREAGAAAEAAAGAGAGAGAESEVEIVYFGLLPNFIGRGLGGALLTGATKRAWALGAEGAGGRSGVRRVWLHTCSLDGPHALANYRARGYRVYRTETRGRTLPEAPHGPWPGARGDGGGGGG